MKSKPNKDMTPSELIETMTINPANLEHIATTGKINGSLLVEIKRVMEVYAKSKWDEACEAQKQLCIESWKSGFIPTQSPKPEFKPLRRDTKD